MPANWQSTVSKLSYKTNGWEITVDNAFDPQASLRLLENCYIFLHRNDYPPQGGPREELLNHFNLPEFVSNRACTEMNGYFGYRPTYNDEKEVISCSTWFRCLIKMIRKIPENPHENEVEYVTDVKGMKKGYTWFEMGIFTRWDHPNMCKVLCVDTPPDLPLKLKAALEKRPSHLEFRDPFAMQVDLIDQIIVFYDISVWRVRDRVRLIDKSRNVELNLEEMRDISRSASHVSEIISATIESMEEMQRHQMVIQENLPYDLRKTYQEQAKAYTSFQLQMLKSLNLRSDFSQKWLQNEITRAYKVAAARDTSNMKIIAILTVLFLPFTFMAILLTTPIFKWSDPPEGQVLVTLPFIIYWTTSFGLAVVVGTLIWYFASSNGNISGGIWNLLAFSRKNKWPNGIAV